MEGGRRSCAARTGGTTAKPTRAASPRRGTGWHGIPFERERVHGTGEGAGGRAVPAHLTDFDRLQQETGSDQELYDAMTELYPDRVSHQTWLMFGFQQA
ncbi:hypothetical protein ABZV29_05115 [Streptomyces sp. NPDC005236]|uniref:hypothetical protein n=1 Tax=Streptomyces sp. NPDC005236 TaxID=3157028 RepID=UPI0033AAC15C